VSGENYIMRSFMICTVHQILFGRQNKAACDGRAMWHVWGRGEMHTGFLMRKPEGKRPLGRLKHI